MSGGGRRPTFFTGLNQSQIKARCKAAWDNRSLQETQVDPSGTMRLRYRGKDPVSGETIEFWFNKSSGLVETAYPVYPK